MCVSISIFMWSETPIKNNNNSSECAIGLYLLYFSTLALVVSDAFQIVGFENGKRQPQTVHKNTRNKKQRGTYRERIYEISSINTLCEPLVREYRFQLITFCMFIKMIQFFNFFYFSPKGNDDNCVISLWRRIHKSKDNTVYKRGGKQTNNNNND